MVASAVLLAVAGLVYGPPPIESPMATAAAVSVGAAALTSLGLLLGAIASPPPGSRRHALRRWNSTPDARIDRARQVKRFAFDFKRFRNYRGRTEANAARSKSGWSTGGAIA